MYALHFLTPLLAGSAGNFLKVYGYDEGTLPIEHPWPSAMKGAANFAVLPLSMFYT